MRNKQEKHYYYRFTDEETKTRSEEIFAQSTSNLVARNNLKLDF